MYGRPLCALKTEQQLTHVFYHMLRHMWNNFKSYRNTCPNRCLSPRPKDRSECMSEPQNRAVRWSTLCRANSSCQFGHVVDHIGTWHAHAVPSLPRRSHLCTSTMFLLCDVGMLDRAGMGYQRRHNDANLGSHEGRHVYTSLYWHVHRHVCGHVYRNIL